MAALSSPRTLSPLGSGGKIRRARRSLPAASPYLRPVPGPGLSSSLDSPKHGWLSTALRSVASTAGKLLSAFRSESSSSSSSRSSSTSSSFDGIGESDEYEDVDGLCRVCSKKADDLYTNENIPAATPSNEKEPQSFTQDRSKTKLAIEYLLMQETYTREECMKLTKVIQSRVVDGPITEEGKDAVVKGLYDQSFGNATPPSENRLSLSQKKKSPHLFSHSENRWSIFSPKSSFLHTGSPDVYKTAITEAKKWFQEKKSETNSKSNLDQERCTLNTDLLSYDNEGEKGSPVDLAKSYMQSRPPWASPSLLNVTMKRHSPIQLQFSDDETQLAMSHQSPSLETAKRSSGFIESSGIHEEVRKFWLKLEESISEHSMLKQNEAPPRLLANVSGETSLFAHEMSEWEVVSHKSNSAQVGNVVTGSAILPPQLEVDNGDSGGTIRSSHGHDVEGNFVTDVGNGKLADPSSLNTLSNSGEDAVAEKHDFSMHGDELCTACPNLSLRDNHQDLGDAYLCQQNGGSGTKSTAPTSLPTQNIGATVGEPADREVLLSQENWCSVLSDTDRRVNDGDASISKASSEMCSPADKVVDEAVEPVKVSCFADESSLPDLKQQQACDPIQNVSSNKTEAGESSSSRSSVPMEPSVKSGAKSSKKSQKQSSMRAVGLASSQEVHELQSDTSEQVPSDVERKDIEAETQTSSRENAPKGHANGNRRTEVGYKRRRTGK